MEPITKSCSRCFSIKELSEFAHNPHGIHQRHSSCRECQRALSKIHYQKNKEKVRAKSKLYQANPNNKEAIKARQKKWLELPNNRIAKNFRTRIWSALGSAKKSKNTEKLTGISFEKCKAYLESLFLPGMSWNDRKSFHIDHYIPCSFFNLEDPFEQSLCFCYLNLRPTYPHENWSKHATLPPDHLEFLEKLKDYVLKRSATKSPSLEQIDMLEQLFLN